MTALEEPPASAAISSAAPPNSATIADAVSGLNISNNRLNSPSREAYLQSLQAPSAVELAHITSIQQERARERRHSSASRPTNSTDAANAELTQAAQLIQRTYRGYRTRRALNGMTIDASSRWVSTVQDARFRNHMAPRPSGLEPTMSPGSPQSLAAARWRKAGAVFQRAGNDIDPESDGDSDSSSSSSSSSSDDASSPEAQRKKEEKRRKSEEARLRHKNQAMMMNISYFLEMVDLKHRYGGNLLVYHNEWKHDTTTNENFFYWLDYGGGKDLDIDSCPRERLNRECVRYLTREERQYYLVKIDSEGRLRWAKNNELLNTTEEYRDSVEGIVPINSDVPGYSASPDTTLVTSVNDALSGSRRNSANSISSVSIRHSPRSSLSGDENATAHRHYPNPVPEAKNGKAPSKTKHIKASHFSTTAVLNKLLRKSIRANTWIFVADTRFRLYVGIKMSGTFQHSSFLQGSRIAAAGLIQVKDGKLTSLSPLSGHYRPPASNYKHFVKSLKTEGADLSHLKISKAYIILSSMETYAKTKDKSKKFMEKLVGHKPKHCEEEEITEKKGNK